MISLLKICPFNVPKTLILSLMVFVLGCSSSLKKNNFLLLDKSFLVSGAGFVGRCSAGTQSLIYGRTYCICAFNRFYLDGIYNSQGARLVDQKGFDNYLATRAALSVYVDCNKASGSVHDFIQGGTEIFNHKKLRFTKSP
ncbi:MAG: hypothetical protein R3213_00845 [Flavobacteriaceae bacterium]|nr:hypothetical protein [Flavobacteriaceae bacterium]